MRRPTLSIVVVLLFVSLHLAACGREAPSPTSKVEPAAIEPVGETELNRLVLTAKAYERLGIQTIPVRDELVTRNQMVGGMVEAMPDSAGDGSTVAMVRVPRAVIGLLEIATDQPALIQSLDADDEAAGLTAHVVEMAAADAAGEEALYLALDSPEHNLVPGQRVRVHLTLAGSGTQKKIVPYSAVLYDLNGDTWTYTSPEPLTFIRHPISVEYIEGDTAVLLDGPPSGTEVVTVGVAELYGTEFGVGK